MRSIDQIVDEIKLLDATNEPFDDYYRIADEVAAHPNGLIAVRAILELFERFPNEDFGAPGPLAHAAEAFMGRGYEGLLLQSITRTPTMHTVSLAMAAANGSEHFRHRLHEALKTVQKSEGATSISINDAIQEYFRVLRRFANE